MQLGDDDDDDDEPKQRYQIARILHSVDQWSQRVSWLELQLMIKQASSSVSIFQVSRVPTPPGTSWIFFLKIPGPGKSWKITLVLESPGN